MGRLKLLWWTALVVALGALSYSSRVAEGTPDRDVLYRYSTAVGSAVSYAVILAIVLAIAGRERHLLALRPPRAVARAVGLSLAVLVGIVVVTAALEQVLHGGKEQGLTPSGWQPEHAGAYAANFVVVAGFAPLVEELLYRGLGGSLLARYGVPVAIALTGVAFAAAHGLVRGFPALLVFGCALAWLRFRTDSILPCVALHATFNAIALVTAVAGP